MAGLQQHEEKQAICRDLSLPVKPLFRSTFEHSSPGFSCLFAMEQGACEGDTKKYSNVV